MDGDKEIWADDAYFENVNLTLPPGQRVKHTFAVENPKSPAYDGPFDMKFNMKF